MKRGPIGVWFSLALGILLLSTWAGSVLGSRFAGYWYGQYQPGMQILPRAERVRVEFELDELSRIGWLRFFANVAPEEKKPEYTLHEIKKLEELERRSKDPEIKSVMDLELGLAYVRAAMTEERNNHEESAKKYMQSAQAIFKSLGWQDYSEETLKTVARRGVEEHPRPKANEK